MSNRPWIDPELAEALARVPRHALPGGFLDFDDLPASRARAAALRPPMPASESVAVEDRQIPGSTAGSRLRLRVYRPKDQHRPLPLLYWIHGGGMVMGSPDGDDVRLSMFVDQVPCVATSIDYRLAPEHPHPTPVEDCYAGLVWVAGNAEALGIRSGQIAIGGASAGAGLAAGTALLARDRGDPPLAFQLLVYPMIDDRNTTPSSHEVTSLGVWDRDTNVKGWKALLGADAAGAQVSPYAAPSRSTDLTGLPPTYIDVGTADLFRDEDIEFAQRLMQSGVPTELRVYPGAFHGFEGYAPSARVTQAAWAGRIAALSRAFAIQAHRSQDA